MKKIKLQSIAFVLFLATAISSCSSDSDSTPTTPQPILKSAYATEVSGPLTAKVEQQLSYSVDFQVENDCGEFNKMTDVEFNKLAGYQVEVKYPATCSGSIPVIKRTLYKFTSPKIPGTYYLRFAKSETEFITTTVVITN